MSNYHNNSHSNGNTIFSNVLTNGSIPDMSGLSVETPRFMMRIDGVTLSHIDKFEEAIPIISFTWGISRETSPHTSGHLFSSGKIRGHNTDVVLYKSVQVMNMINSLSTGEKIPEIVIDELATIGENNVSTETHTYQTCYFLTAANVINPSTSLPSNFLKLTFRYTSYNIEFHEYDQDGTALGSNSTSFNFKTSMGGADVGGSND